MEPELPAPYWDFRAHSLELVTVPGEQDYTADCLQARTLLSQAGYPNGTVSTARRKARRTEGSSKGA